MSKNVLKFDLKNPRFVPFEASLTQFGANPTISGRWWLSPLGLGHERGEEARSNCNKTNKQKKNTKKQLEYSR